MKLAYIVISCFLILFSISLVSALKVDIPISTSVNYSSVNTNYSSNSGLLQGLTPSQVANLFTETDPLSLHLNKNNWNLGSDWLTYSNPTLDFNESKLSVTYYNATQSGVITGTIDGGTLANTQHLDGDYDGITMNFSEASGSPALDLRMNFTGITKFTNGVMRYKTSSLSGNYPIIQVWNWVDSSWEDYPDVAQSLTFATITQPVFDSTDHVGTGSNLGIVQMRIYKASNGNTNNHYYVDWIAISKGFGTPAGNEVDPFSYHLNQSIDLSDKNITTTGTGTFGNVLINSVSGYPLDVYTYYGTVNQNHAFAFDPTGYFMISPDLVAGSDYALADNTANTMGANSLMSAGLVIADEGMVGQSYYDSFVPLYLQTYKYLHSGTPATNYPWAIYIDDGSFNVDENYNLTTTGTGKFKSVNLYDPTTGGALHEATYAIKDWSGVFGDTYPTLSNPTNYFTVIEGGVIVTSISGVQPAVLYFMDVDNFVASLIQQETTGTLTYSASSGIHDFWDDSITTTGTGTFSGLNSTGNVTIGNLLQLQSMVLPACSSTYLNNIGANATNTYMCNSSCWIGWGKTTCG